MVSPWTDLIIDKVVTFASPMSTQAVSIFSRSNLRPIAPLGPMVATLSYLDAVEVVDVLCSLFGNLVLKIKRYFFAFYFPLELLQAF